MIFLLSLVLRKTLYKIESGPFKKLLHVFDFIGVVVHEVSHASACIMMRVPIKEIHFGWKTEITRNVAPHGHVSTGMRDKNFLKITVISLAPLIISTWLFILCLDLAFDARMPDLLRLFCGFMCLSLILGASPSSTDFALIPKYFNFDVQYSLYQLFLLTLSVITIMLIMLIFKVIIIEILYLFLFGIGYYIYKYSFLGLSIIFRNPNLRIKRNFNMNTYMRKTQRPLEPYKLGFEEAHW